MNNTQKRINNSNDGQNTKKKILIAICLLLFGFFVLLAFSANWLLYTWNNLSMDEFIFHLKAPLQGTGNSVLINYALFALLPTVLCLAAVSFLLFHFQRSKNFYILLSSVLILSVCVFCGTLFAMETRLGIISYLRTNGEKSVFIENHYADPKTVRLSFPEKKRNLIYIFLESMEVTYSDPENGGAFEPGLIDELTQIAKEGEDFSDVNGVLNGAFVLPGTTWTMGAMFAHSSGLPLLIDIDSNSMQSQDHFFTGTETLGDILADEGYRNVLLLGSEAVFGGRELYYKEHGDYEIRDYNYAKENGWIEEDYYVWWGYEDEKLFAFAKETLQELSSTGEPFNLTILTVDTHFENGYVCRLCEDQFDGNRYANVMACSSRQVSGFLNWLKDQDFYENTTVIIVGDHLTMDRDFLDDLDSSYVRKVYTCFLNSAVSKKTEAERVYNTMDYFPTTLAALGVEIQGERLGLGTNLYSSKKTLLEEYGLDFITTEFWKKSDFMSELANIEDTDILNSWETQTSVTAEIEVSDDPDAQCLTVAINNIESNSTRIERIEARLRLKNNPDNVLRFTLTGARYETNELIIDYGKSDFSPDDIEEMEFYAIVSSGNEYRIEAR